MAKGIGRRKMCCVDLCPCLYYRDNLGRCEIGESEVMARGEGEDEAFSCYWLGAEEER